MNRDKLVAIIGPTEVERLEREDCDIRNCAIAPGGVEWVAQIRVNIDGDAFIAEAVYRPSEDEQIRLGNQESIEWEVDHYNIPRCAYHIIDDVSDANKFRRIIER